MPLVRRAIFEASATRSSRSTRMTTSTASEEAVAPGRPWQCRYRQRQGPGHRRCRRRPSRWDGAGFGGDGFDLLEGERPASTVGSRAAPIVWPHPPGPPFHDCVSPLQRARPEPPAASPSGAGRREKRPVAAPSLSTKTESAERQTPAKGPRCPFRGPAAAKDHGGRAGPDATVTYNALEPRSKLFGHR